MKARPAKSKKRTLHQPPVEMMNALMHHNEGWAKMMEAERAKHAKERCADYKQPYRIAPCSKGEWEYSYARRNRKKLIKLWESQGLNIPEMMKLYGLTK